MGGVAATVVVVDAIKEVKRVSVVLSFVVVCFSVLVLLSEIY